MISDYIYGVKITGLLSDSGPGMTVIPFRVTKVTASRVYYQVPNPDRLRGDLDAPEHRSAYVSRADLERAGPRGLSCDRRDFMRRDTGLFQTRQEAERYQRWWTAKAAHEARADESAVRQLRRAMLAANPDRGGTAEDFMAARERYLRAVAVPEFEAASAAYTEARKEAYEAQRAAYLARQEARQREDTQT